MPSPTRLNLRWTRKKPTAGASTPTTMPAPNASRMNSRSSMCVRRVVPDTRQGRGGPVEDDLASNQDESFDESLDRAELVRDVQDGHAELVSQPLEQRGDRILCLDVHAGRRLVEDQQVRLRRKCLGDERALLLAAGERRQPAVGLGLEAHPLDGVAHRNTVGTCERPEQPRARRTPRGDQLADRERRVDPGLRPLREVADLPREPLDAARSGLRESDGQADERSLAAAVRAGDRDELSALDLEIDIAEDGRAGSVCERDGLEPKRY